MAENKKKKGGFVNKVLSLYPLKMILSIRVIAS
ncbi:hypothetical protein M2135_003049 [Parabacteroides sp. PF5-9]|nr:hypothetical protein [Parabacteroides sp. PF5-9]